MAKPYFSHDINARNDKKIAALVMDYKSSGYGIFWCAVEMLHDEDGIIDLDDLMFSHIAKDLNEDFELVKEVLNKCQSKYNLFKLIDNRLTSNRVVRNLDIKRGISEERSRAGKAGAIAKQNQAFAKQTSAIVEQTQASVQQTQANKLNKVNKESINVTPELIAATVGSEKVKAAANEAWGDKEWIFNTCKAHQMTEKDLTLWLYQYNASVSNDPINGFNAAKYKKMFGGWLNTQIAKGYKIPVKPSDGKLQLTTLKP